MNKDKSKAVQAVNPNPITEGASCALSNVTALPVTRTNPKKSGNFMSLNTQAIEAIYLHKITSQCLKVGELIIAYMALSKSQQQKQHSRKTTAGVKAIRKALNCGWDKANEVFIELKTVVDTEGVCIIGNSESLVMEGKTWKTLELTCTEDTRYIYFPNDTFKKLTAKPKAGRRRTHKTKMTSETMRLFLKLFQHHEPMEYWGFNPYTSISLHYADEYDTFEPAPETITNNGYRFSFYSQTYEKIFQDDFTASFFRKPSEEVTPKDRNLLYSMLNDLYGRGYLHYSVIVFDVESGSPEYRLYTSDHYKNNSMKAYAPLQEDVKTLYKSITGNNSLIDDKDSPRYFLTASYENQLTTIKGVYSPNFNSGLCGETAAMIATSEANTEQWREEFQSSIKGA